MSHALAGIVALGYAYAAAEWQRHSNEAIEKRLGPVEITVDADVSQAEVFNSELCADLEYLGVVQRA